MQVKRLISKPRANKLLMLSQRVKLSEDAIENAVSVLGALSGVAPVASIPHVNIKMLENQVIEPRILEVLERVKGFEPSTPTLARLCSTTELHPRCTEVLNCLHS